MDDAWWGPPIALPGGPYFCLAGRSLPGCILVNGAGQRFVNESAPYVDAVHAMYEADTPENPHIPAWLMFDQRSRARYVSAWLPPHRPLPRRWYAAGSPYERSYAESPRRAGTRTSAAATRRTTATTAT